MHLGQLLIAVISVCQFVYAMLPRVFTSSTQPVEYRAWKFKTRILNQGTKTKNVYSTVFTSNKKRKKSILSLAESYIAEEGFDPPTSGLWAQHASAAPLCYFQKLMNFFIN